MARRRQGSSGLHTPTPVTMEPLWKSGRSRPKTARTKSRKKQGANGAAPGFMLSAALDYVAKGWSILPLWWLDQNGVCTCHKKHACAHPGKHPIPPHGEKAATTDKKIIEHWWRKYPKANIGGATGILFDVIDLDVKKGKDGWAALDKLVVELGPLPRTRTNTTPSHGKHFLFQHVEGIRTAIGKLGVGLDVKASYAHHPIGGYIVLPPSHDGGYKCDDPKTPIAELPAGWIERLQKLRGKGKAKRIVTSQPVEKSKIVTALSFIPSDDYYVWLEVGCALYKELGDEGFELFDEFSKKSEKYNDAEVAEKWDECQKISGYNVNTIFFYASQNDPNWRHSGSNDVGVNLKDFWAYMPMHNYFFAPSREPWPASSVNVRVPPVVVGTDKDGKPIKIKASTWIDQNQPFEMLTWAPGLPLIIKNRLISEGGWIMREGVSCFNKYRPPTIEPGDANKAGPWIDLVHTVFPDDADHIIKWFAQRVQQPEIKINHALLLGSSEQGIGKDTLLEPVKRAVGPWNFKEIAPTNIFDDFNPWRQAVILRVSEAKDMGDVSRFALYDKMKTLIAAPPDVLDCNEKYIKQHYVLNCMGVIITSNHLTDGIYLLAEDRRHYVAWSDCKPTGFPPGFWNEMWSWYDTGGDGHVAAYLATLDISNFDPKAPPPKTAAFWSIVNANRTSEEAELQDVLDKLGNPDAVTIEAIRIEALPSLREWLKEPKNRKAVTHRFENCGYRAVNNQGAKDGLWKIDGRRQVVYAKTELSLADQLKAVEELPALLKRWAAEKAAKVAAEAAASGLTYR
jgi:Bifunctional DNA primase/polymerase, N-terminal/Primase C terminal 2 (PriCT-2)/Family of unknown function (DUF5906)